MDDEMSTPQEVQIAPPLRRHHGEDRRRLHEGEYDGVERRIPDPPCEQDFDREAPPN
jgi:hypothetical protein